jgi:hypothetical protein
MKLPFIMTLSVGIILYLEHLVFTYITVNEIIYDHDVVEDCTVIFMSPVFINQPVLTLNM